MKIRNILLFTLMLAWISCGDKLAELNIDPNSSPTARPQEVLTAGQVEYAEGLEAILNENHALFAQYWAGGPGVAILDHERYFFEAADFNGYFTRLYRQALSDLDFVGRNGSNHHKAIAEITSVMIYQNLVDLFGDIPYSEALKGTPEDGSILTPKYDKAEDVYADLIKRLDAAQALIDGGSSISVGSEDLIYQGNMAKWTKFANSLKLRLLMRQSTKNANVGAAVAAVINNGNFISSAGDIPQITFTGETGGWNPQYARRESGIKMFYVLSNTLLNRMQNDPRLAKLFNVAVTTKTIVGLDQGNINDVNEPKKDDYSYPSTVQYSKSNPVIFMSHWEVAFLIAEAAARFGTGDKVALLGDAVSKHFTYVGAGDASTYVTGLNLPELSDDGFINVLGIQKWISMCGLQETEGWIETRRFDRPGNNIFTNGIFKTPTRTVLGQGVFPSICLYPQNELSFNGNTPKGRKITDKVFWDN